MVEWKRAFLGSGPRKRSWLRPPLVWLLFLLGLSELANAAPQLSADQRQLLDLYVRPENFTTRTRWTVLPASSNPLPLAADGLRTLNYKFKGQDFTLQDYFDRQPVTALLIAKNGRIVFEKYQYSGSSSSLFYSASMAKSLVGISVALVEHLGLIPSQDITAGQIIKELEGTPLGETSIRNHMRMGSGVRYSESYPRDDSDDHSRFTKTVESDRLVQAFEQVKVRDVPQGTRFEYAGVSTGVLSAVVRAASGKSTARFFGDEIWAKLGTEAQAYWAEDKNGDTWGYCCFLGRARDYLRLGLVLANQGKRPDTGAQIIPSNLISRISNISALEPPFRPPLIKGGMGYDSQFWLSSRVPESFALVGLYGQLISVFPKSGVVMVHFGMTGTSSTNNAVNAERDAMVAGVLSSLR